MITTFTTKSGSKYEIDYESSTWTRIKAGKNFPPGPTPLRTTTGVFINHPIVAVGHRVLLLGSSLTEGMAFRVISTSPVTDMESRYNAESASPN